MEENPFIITEHVTRQYFCDREKETEELIRLVTNRNNVVLLSDRRIGKTALIQHCYQQKPLKDTYLTFYVDILSTTNLQEFTFLLGRAIYERLVPLGKKMVNTFFRIVKSITSRLGYDTLSGMPTINLQLGDVERPDITLQEIFKYLSEAEKPCVVAIDEFQQIAKYPEKGVEALIRSHLLQINNVRIIFSGSERHMLSEMFMHSSRPFYMSASFIDLKVIPKEIYVDFIVKMFKKGDKTISKDLATEIYERFDGITFCIQKICNILYSKTLRGETADRENYGTAIEEILNSYDPYFREQLSRLSTRQKEVLFAIASKGKVENVTSMEFIKEHSLASASSVQTSIKSLIKMMILNTREKKYWIDDRFFSLWVKKNFCQ
ncbi:MAG: ATP-binding protein [Muribaculaceae bacterium]|nr:ATP-binding protein [Muribaculaceae bacterium]